VNQGVSQIVKGSFTVLTHVTLQAGTTVIFAPASYIVAVAVRTDEKPVFPSHLMYVFLAFAFIEKFVYM